MGHGFRLGIFTGAGISCAAPANLPAGFALRDLILDDCFRGVDRHVRLGRTTKEWVRDRSGWKLEYVMSRLAGTIGDDAADVVHALSVRLPNDAHMRLACHIATGCGPQYTLNFDEGIELAYGLLRGDRDLPVDADVRYGAELVRWRSRLPASFPELSVLTSKEEIGAWAEAATPYALVKLHGGLSSLDGSTPTVRDLVILDELELAFLPPEHLAGLDVLRQCSRVLVTGYSGLDIDCFDPLLDCIEGGIAEWVAPGHPVPELATRLASTRGVRWKSSDASSWLTSAGFGPPDPWPTAALPDDAFADRYAEWSKALWANHGPNRLAEAMAWMLRDARRSDEAIEVLEALLSSGAGASTRTRLAEALYERSRPGDRPRARRVFGAMVLDRTVEGPTRRHALSSLGASFRHDAFTASTRWRRAASFVLAVGAPAASALCALVTRSPRTEAARPMSMIGHFGLRWLEHRIAHRPHGQRWRRWGDVALGRADRWVLRRALTAFEAAPERTGNPEVMIKQQLIECEALVAICRRCRLDPSLLEDVERLHLAYVRKPDPAGVANTLAAMGLVAVATSDWSAAAQYLDRAERAYRRELDDDPSGTSLVLVRRRILDAARRT